MTTSSAASSAAAKANGGTNGHIGQHHQNGNSGPSDGTFDVCVVGAGPAGLMLGSLLARFGQKVHLIDERPDQTTVGRADGIQPKSIETLQMLRIGDDLLRDGVKVHDICMWQSSNESNLHRLSRSIHYPASVVDLLQPYILLCHQGMIEAVFIKDLRRSGFEVKRSHRFQTYTALHDGSLQIEAALADHHGNDSGITTIHADYVVGCDGARSRVRQTMSDIYALQQLDDAQEGTKTTTAVAATPPPQTGFSSVWGVLDGELETDFPDIWSKTVVFSERHGSILIIPRERNMTRFYIEMKSSSSSSSSAPSSSRAHLLGQEYVMEQARLILAPYRVKWRSVEWFGNYHVAQRVAAHFSDLSNKVFIAGDASHTHSPKAAQGMNTSIHDAWNLGWKLNLALRGLAKEADGGSKVLGTYELERKKIAYDLINFDFEHANEIAGGDAKRLAENFRTNTRFISGVGVEYGENELNRWGRTDTVRQGAGAGAARPGCNLPPAKATRYIDACPVDVQLDIPILGQFRIYAVLDSVVSPSATSFLASFNDAVAAESSLFTQLSRAAAHSYGRKPRASRADDKYVRPERYTRVSELCTLALIISTDKNEFEISSLPSVFSRSEWTIYLDDVASLDTQGRSCIEKWLGGLGEDEAAVMIVRPDGYVGSIGRWNMTDEAASAAGQTAAQWVDDYFGGFLQVPLAG